MRQHLQVTPQGILHAKPYLEYSSHHISNRFVLVKSEIVFNINVSAQHLIEFFFRYQVQDCLYLLIQILLFEKKKRRGFNENLH